VTNETFWAEKGKGAFVNDHRLRVGARQRLDESSMATGIPFLGHGQHAKFLKELHQISQRVAGVRRFGSARWTWPGSRPGASTATGSAT
jgi:myo-inositol-1(or 4)-monophosphatase